MEQKSLSNIGGSTFRQVDDTTPQREIVAFGAGVDFGVRKANDALAVFIRKYADFQGTQRELLANELHEWFEANAGVEPDLEEVRTIVLDGLKCDGDHHKQWYLEQVAGALGMEINYDEIDEGCPP